MVSADVTIIPRGAQIARVIHGEEEGLSLLFASYINYPFIFVSAGTQTWGITL